ncbi:unnamed protein product [Onchocerca flexuosa]|uniref:Clp R domain-containing protein n=1 Tax=Onchocerca flexuosa TaxID=387005 RepID=A0A183I167_9BILA|nr:unnamed protein product [Onchocerca flexuosa]
MGQSVRSILKDQPINRAIAWLLEIGERGISEKKALQIAISKQSYIHIGGGGGGGGGGSAVVVVVLGRSIIAFKN